MWKNVLTFCRYMRCRILQPTGGKYLKKEYIDAKHHNSLVCAGPGKKTRRGPAPLRSVERFGCQSARRFPVLGDLHLRATVPRLPELAGVFLRALRARPSQGVNPAPSGEIAFAFLRFSQRLRAAWKRKFQGGAPVSRGGIAGRFDALPRGRGGGRRSRRLARWVRNRARG